MLLEGGTGFTWRKDGANLHLLSKRQEAAAHLLICSHAATDDERVEIRYALVGAAQLDGPCHPILQVSNGYVLCARVHTV